MNDIYPRYGNINTSTLEKDVLSILKEKLDKEGYFTMTYLIDDLGVVGLKVEGNPDLLGWKSMNGFKISDTTFDYYVKTLQLPPPCYIVTNEDDFVSRIRRTAKQMEENAAYVAEFERRC